MKYDYVLFDADDTLFDFQRCALKCFTETCICFGVPKEKIDYPAYSVINQNLWDLYSVGRIEKSVILVKRFADYFDKFGLALNPEKFFAVYEEKLSHTAIAFPDSEQTLIKIREMGIKLYLITNGVKKVQRGRLKISGFDKYFDGIFISDEVGYAKPSKEYYECVKSSIENFNPDKALICGDSLVSDIPLGLNNGIDTCRFNPERLGNPNNIFYNYEISNISEILDILK